jgi:hypothetical protein
MHKDLILQNLICTLLVLASTLLVSVPCLAEDIKSLKHGKPVVSHEVRANGHKTIKAKILIDAPVHVVWSTVHDQRKLDTDLAYSKIVEDRGNHNYLIEQKFLSLPLIGTAICVMDDYEIPNKQISYKLVRSDRFKAMEGSWVLSPQGNQTILELSSYVDMGIPCPRMIVDASTAKRLERRLNNVKRFAEEAHTGIASKTNAKVQ